MRKRDKSQQQNVYLVEDTQDAPGRILAAFTTYEHAMDFAADYPDACEVSIVKLHASYLRRRDFRHA